MNGKPRVAVVGNNTLALIGLRHLLQSVMPMIEVDTLGSFAELTANNPDQYFHYFVSIEIMLSERAFFLERRRKTIVLTTVFAIAEESVMRNLGKLLHFLDERLIQRYKRETA